MMGTARHVGEHVCTSEQTPALPSSTIPSCCHYMNANPARRALERPDHRLRPRVGRRVTCQDEAAHPNLVLCTSILASSLAFIDGSVVRCFQVHNGIRAWALPKVRPASTRLANANKVCSSAALRQSTVTRLVMREQALQQWHGCSTLARTLALAFSSFSLARPSGFFFMALRTLRFIAMCQVTSLSAFSGRLSAS